jgi:glutathione S-transferase
MKFYNSPSPNPRVVRMFMAEKEIVIPTVAVDLRGGENRRAAYLARNPAGQTPCLELDDGFFLAEVPAICDYLEELYPTPALIGSTPRERAETRMWTNRITLSITEPMSYGYRYSQALEMFRNRIHCIPQAADDLKQIAQEKLAWLDPLIAGKEFVCGERLTLADILLYCFLEFGAERGQPINPALTAIVAHYARMKARPSAAA